METVNAEQRLAVWLIICVAVFVLVMSEMLIGCSYIETKKKLKIRLSTITVALIASYLVI